MCHVMSITFVRCANYLCTVDTGMSSRQFAQSLLMLHVKKELCSLGAGNSASSECILPTKQLLVINFNGSKHGLQKVIRLSYSKTEAGVSLF